MTYLWAGMILTGILYGTLTGNLGGVTEAAVASSREAVELCVAMAGITAMWTGIMKIAEMSGLVAALARRLQPLLGFLFPELKQESKARQYISLNFLSNFLGLGWASTASGLKAFKELDRINREEREKQRDKKNPLASSLQGPETASSAMCTFLIMNVSSLQLIPVNMIAYRGQYGSPRPAARVGPAIAATAVSTAAAVIFCKIMGRRNGG